MTKCEREGGQKMSIFVTPFMNDPNPLTNRSHKAVAKVILYKMVQLSYKPPSLMFVVSDRF